MIKTFDINDNKKIFPFWKIEKAVTMLENGFYQLDNKGRFFRYRDKFFDRITKQSLKSVLKNTNNTSTFDIAYQRVYSMDDNNTISSEDVRSLIIEKTLVLIHNGYIYQNHDGFFIFSDIPTTVYTSTDNKTRQEKTSVVSYLFHCVYEFMMDNKRNSHKRLYTYSEDNKEVSIFNTEYLKQQVYDSDFTTMFDGITSDVDKLVLSVIDSSKYANELHQFIIYRCAGYSLRECANKMNTTKQHIETLKKVVNKVYDDFYKPARKGFDGNYNTIDRQEYITSLLCGDIKPSKPFAHYTPAPTKAPAPTKIDSKVVPYERISISTTHTPAPKKASKKQLEKAKKQADFYARMCGHK